MTKRNRNREKKKKKPDPRQVHKKKTVFLSQVNQNLKMVKMRCNFPSLMDCWRKLFSILRRSVFFAVIVFGGFSALTFKKPKDRGDSSDPEASDKDQNSGENVPEESGEPFSVVCHGAPAEAGRGTAESSREPAAEPGGRPSGEEEEEEEEDEDEEFDSREYRVAETDELYCEYDSTWETEKTNSETMRDRERPRMSNYKFNRFRNAAKDMQNYRRNYPEKSWIIRQRMQQDDKPNLSFYLGLRPSSPDGVFIKDFHNHWYGQYDQLEYVHSYIQWLFPLQEPGLNYEARELTKEEIEDFLKNSTAKKNLLESYKLMLDFYGIQLLDEKTGKVNRAPNWRERFLNLNRHTHNNLRITRILKCLGTLGFAHYQAPLVHFFLKETLVHKQLENVKDSVLSYFMFGVLDKTKRRDLIRFAYLNYDRKEEFVWCPKQIQRIWSRQARDQSVL
ncbi:hypothetical protein LDENG_00058030 [Lucifuga dentata]|nr:hypothetical protein LDENG_00058030 [Lucifuga dentata]